MEDKDIIQLYWDRDYQAIKATADKYGHYCQTIAKNILNNREDGVSIWRRCGCGD